MTGVRAVIPSVTLHSGVPAKKPHENTPRTQRLRREFAGTPLGRFALSSRGSLARRRLQFRGADHSQELASGGLQDANIDELTWRDVAAFQHHGALALPDPSVMPVELILSLDQDLHVAADPLSRLPRCNASLQGQEVVQAAQLLLVRDVILHPARSKRAGSRRVHGQVDDLELDLLEQSAGVQERRL